MKNVQRRRQSLYRGFKAKHALVILNYPVGFEKNVNIGYHPKEIITNTLRRVKIFDKKSEFPNIDILKQEFLINEKRFCSSWFFPLCGYIQRKELKKENGEFIEIKVTPEQPIFKCSNFPSERITETNVVKFQIIESNKGSKSLEFTRHEVSELWKRFKDIVSKVFERGIIPDIKLEVNIKYQLKEIITKHFKSGFKIRKTQSSLESRDSSSGRETKERGPSRRKTTRNDIFFSNDSKSSSDNYKYFSSSNHSSSGNDIKGKKEKKRITEIVLIFKKRIKQLEEMKMKSKNLFKKKEEEYKQREKELVERLKKKEEEYEQREKELKERHKKREKEYEQREKELKERLEKREKDLEESINEIEEINKKRFDNFTKKL